MISSGNCEDSQKTIHFIGEEKESLLNQYLHKEFSSHFFKRLRGRNTRSNLRANKLARVSRVRECVFACQAR